MEFIKKNIGYLIALFGLGFFVYLFNLKGPLFWDDADWIVNNFSVHSFSWSNIKFIFSHDVLASIGQVSNYYRPFLLVTFMGNYIFSGDNPVSYHLVSNGIHILNSGLVFYLLSRWLKSTRPAFLIALLFLIHPLQTEAVAYISGRGDPLSVLLMLTCLVIYLHTQQATGLKKLFFGLLSAGMAILAILSRETAVLLPAYLGVVLIAFENKGLFWERLKKSFISIIPFAVISVVYFILRLTVLNFQDTLNFYQQQNIYSENFLYRSYTFLHALVVYFKLAIWPIGLHMDRDIPISISLFGGWVLAGLILILVITGILVAMYRKTDKTDFNIWFFGAGIFFLNLLPSSGVVPINARIYEHWLYFSLIGFFTILVWYFDKLWKITEIRKQQWRPALIVLVLTYCLFLGAQTIRRNIIWGDTERFYLNILRYEPSDVRVLNNLGNWYSDNGNNDSAKPLYERAVEADPSQPALYYNLGNIARDKGNLAEAEGLYKKALLVDPQFFYSYGNLAQIYLSQDKIGQALVELEKLQEIYPSEQNAKNIIFLKEELAKRN